MSAGQPASLLQSAGDSDADTIGRDSLVPRRYQTIAETCQEAQNLVRRLGDSRLIGIVDIASQLVDACQESCEEARWYREAHGKACQRQRRLLDELTTIVGALMETGLPAGSEGTASSPSHDLARIPSTSALVREYQRIVGCLASLLLNARGAPQAAKEVRELSHLISDSSSTTAVIEKQSAEIAVPLSMPAKDPGTISGHVENDGESSPSLAVYLLSPFRVLLDEQSVVGWPNCRGKSIFKYLITHRERPIPKEVLMEAFWPETDPDSARNNLNVAIYGLRKILAKVNPSFSYVLFHEGQYLLNPELQIWVDSEAFMSHVSKARELEQRGDKDAAVHEYRLAESVYQCELLVEDRYEDWMFELRQHFQDTYLNVLEHLSQYYFDRENYEACMTVSSKMLAVDACNEGSHWRLMRCYGRLGQPHLAVRQYHHCVEALAKELELTPREETVQLFNQLRTGQFI